MIGFWPISPEKGSGKWTKKFIDDLTRHDIVARPPYLAL